MTKEVLKEKAVDKAESKKQTKSDIDITTTNNNNDQDDNKKNDNDNPKSANKTSSNQSKPKTSSKSVIMDDPKQQMEASMAKLSTKSDDGQTKHGLRDTKQNKRKRELSLSAYQETTKTSKDVENKQFSRRTTIKLKEVEIKSPLTKIISPKGIRQWPEQRVQLLLSNGIEFNILCIGEPECGKSTFIESLFDIRTPGKVTETIKGEIVTHTFTNNSSEFKITINVSYTKNFNTTFDKKKDIQVIHDILSMGDKIYLENETKFDTQKTIDTRNHVIIFFIQPTPNSINDYQLDILATLKNYNVLPVISKSDTMTPQEKLDIKKRFNDAIEEKKIKIFKFPENGSAKLVESNRFYNHLIPFTVIGSKEFIDGPKGKVRARSYSYATIEIENKEHSDFPIIRDAIIKDNLINFIQMSQTGHYAEFRKSIFQKIELSNKSNNALFDICIVIQEMIKKRRKEGKDLKTNYEDMIKEEDIKFNKNMNDLNAEFEHEVEKLRNEIKNLENQLVSIGEANVKKKK